MTSATTAPPPFITCQQLQAWLTEPDEIAVLDIREHGQYGEGHPFQAINTPYSRLETVVTPLVPRLDTRIVLIDENGTDCTHVESADNGLALRAARRLQALGYRRLHVLQGGALGWACSGRTLFKGVNVPSKAFGERIEQVRHTPSISAEELRRLQQSQQALVLVDGRTLEEHRKMTIPGAVPLPNGELAVRIQGLLADEQTPVVVHCAGRTRSLIGAQTLIDLGLSNPVYALENGTQGWRLADFPLEHGSQRQLPPIQSPAPDAARSTTTKSAIAAPRQLSAQQAQAWLNDSQRTTYVFDIRTAEEYAAATLPGARHAAGGQLLQATDQCVGVRNSRVLLLDDDGRRAAVIAHWLEQLGYEAAVVEHGIHAALHIEVAAPATPNEAPLPYLTGEDLARRVAQPASAGHLLLDLRSSMAYRQGHDVDAIWAIRPRLIDALVQAGHPRPASLTLVSEDHETARLAAMDLRERGIQDLAWTQSQTLSAIGRLGCSTPGTPNDSQAIDYLFFVHDRHDGNLDAARRYLAWETGLLGQCHLDELSAWRISSPSQ